MAQTAKSIILSKFEAGDRPTDQDFLNLFDSVLFINNVGQHANGLGTANTSIEGNFKIEGDLEIGGTSTLELGNKLGIGNTAENVTSTLHVYSSHASNPVVFVSGSNTNIMFNGISGDATSSIKLTDPTDFAEFGTHTGKAFISVAGSEYFNITSSNLGPHSFFSGSVGIGSAANTNAAEKFKIFDANSNVTAHLQTSKANGISSIGFQNDAQTYTIGVRGNDNFTIVNTTGTPFKVKSNATDNNLVLDSGNVGIGTTSPGYKLDIIDSANDTQLRIQTDKTDGAAVLRLKNDAQEYTISTTTNDNFAIYDATATNVPFQIEPGTPASTLYLDSTGNIGIGVSSPDEKLHVKGSSNTGIEVDSSFGTDQDVFIKLTNDAQSFSLKTIGSNDHLYIVNETAGTNPLKITADATSNNLVVRNGKVGIGTDNPANTLDVRGDVVLSNGTDNAITLFNNDSVSSGPDIQFHESALIAAEANMHLNINSDGGSANFSIRTGGDTSAADEIFSITSTGQVSASNGFIGDGSQLTGITGGQLTGFVTTPGDNRLITSNASGDAVIGEANLIFDGTNLGIGATTPGVLLDLEGNSNAAKLRITSIDTGQPAKTAHIELIGYEGRAKGILFNDSTLPDDHWFMGAPYVDSAGESFQIGYDGSGDQPEYLANAKLYVSASGNIGIGTTSPDAKLEVAGNLMIRNDNDTGDIMELKNGGGIATGADVLFYSSGLIAAQDTLVASINSTGGDASFQIRTGDPQNGGEGTNNTTQIASFGTGSIGSGLHIKGFTNSHRPAQIILNGSNANFNSSGSDDGARIKLSSRNNQGNFYEASNLDFLVFEKIDSNNDNTPDGGILFTNSALGNGGDKTEKVAMSIQGDGKIGIGMVTPTRTLHLQSADPEVALFQGTVNDQQTFVKIDTANAGTGTHSYVYFNQGGSGKGAVGYRENTDTMALVYDTGIVSNKGINVTSGGNVGINTSSPTEKLDVVETSGDVVARFLGTDNNAYVRISQNVDVTGAAGLLFSNTDGTRGFTGYYDARMRLVWGTGPGNINGIVINSSGNVGINKLSPSEKLHISGGKMIIQDTAVVWNDETPGTSRGSIHLSPQTNTGANEGLAITFGSQDTGGGDTAQAGIYTITDGSSPVSGVDMLIGVADAFATGPQMVAKFGADRLRGINFSNDSTWGSTTQIPTNIAAANISTRVNIRGDASSNAKKTTMLNVYGAGQGDAVIYLGQEYNAGGGLYYKGDTSSDDVFDRFDDSDFVYLFRSDFSGTGEANNSNNPILSYSYATISSASHDDATPNYPAYFHVPVVFGTGSQHRASSNNAYNADGNGAFPQIIIHNHFEGVVDNSSTEDGNAGGGIRFVDNNSDNYYDMAFINDHLVFSHDGSNGNPDQIFQITETTHANTFTGQHYNLPSTGEVVDYNNKIGYIVSSTGIYHNVNNDVAEALPTINEALPKVVLSTQPNDKKAFGVISDATDSNVHWAINGNTKSKIRKNDKRLIINSLGEGAIMVCNINGNLENGDYITTSAIEGLGMKQDDDLLHNYTVAKITQDCDFSSGTTDVTHDGQTYKMKLVGCTYHCG